MDFINRPVYIYALADPRTGDIRYIGRTVHPVRRYNDHCNPNPKSRNATKEWIEELRGEGLRPDFSILAVANADDAAVEEARWVALHRENGALLANIYEPRSLPLRQPGTSKPNPDARLRWQDQQRRPELKEQQRQAVLARHGLDSTTPKYEWSHLYPECVICHTTEHKHQAFGLCVSCYGAARASAIRRNHPSPIAERRGQGRWSLNYDACRKCGKAERPHAAKGLCYRCYSRERYIALPEPERKRRREGYAKRGV